MNLIDWMATHSIMWCLVLFIAELVFWLCIKEDFVRRGLNESQAIELRMKGYELLKPEANECSEPKYSNITLDAGSHEVLLGTLKKVEAKNGVLVTILVFALALTSGSLFSPEPFSNKDHFKAIAISGLIWPLLAAMSGTRQLDQRNFRLLDVRYSVEVAAVRLQKELIKDLMNKELAFRFSSFFTKWIVVMFLAITVFTVVQSKF